MAVKKSTAPVAEVETVEEVEVAELTEKQIINEAIGRVVDATGIDVQKNRYKAMRAIAFQAFSNAIADGSFDALVDEAIANVDELPSGWEIERVEKEEVAAPVKKAPEKAPVKAAAKPAAKATTTKAAATPATKPAARRRPTR